MSPLERLGRLLFRLRSVMPVFVGLAAIVFTWRGHRTPFVSPEVDAALNVAGVVVGVLGLAVRFVTVGLVPQLRSQSRTVGAAELITTGPYALSRHPIYLGNALLVLGLVLIVARWQATALAVVTFVLFYGLIIIAEERALAARFPEAWPAWATQVPRGLSLRNTKALRTGRPFAWRAAVAREIPPLVSFGLSALVLLTWEWWVRGQLTRTTWLSVRLGVAALLLVLVANKVRRLVTVVK